MKYYEVVIDMHHPRWLFCNQNYPWLKIKTDIPHWGIIEGQLKCVCCWY